MDELTAPAGHGPPRGDWLRARDEKQSLVRYVETLRERWRLVLLATVLATFAAAFYVAVAPKVYEAEADLLITPVPTSDNGTSGLGLISESSDPTQDVSTAARLATTRTVAATARSQLGWSRSAEQILGDVTVEPIAQSNLVAVEARAGSALDAARLANAFASAVVKVRTDQLHHEIDVLLPRLQKELEDLPADQRSGPGSLGERIATLQALASGSDPTVRLAAQATPPTSPSSPRSKLAIAAGIIGGLIIGIGMAFATQALDPRLRREEQLRELFRLPLLARIPLLDRIPGTRDGAVRSPWLPRSARRGAREFGPIHLSEPAPPPLAPAQLTPVAVEAYRTLRATLVATLGDEHRSILVTSSSPGEGKTTTAINIADSFAHAGYRVILIEGDMRRPTIASTLGIQAARGIGSVLIKRTELEDALVTTHQYGKNLRFLLVERMASALADRLSLPTARELVAEAEAIADFVVIDSPPLTEVVDAFPLAQEVGGVLVMARLGTSRLRRLADLGEMLHQGGVTPAGIAVLGIERPVEPSAYLTPDPVDAPVA